MIEFREEDIRYIAVELPDEVKYFKYSGDFEGEEKTVISLLAGELPLPIRRRLELELEICREMQRDYYTDFDTLLAKIQEKYPACTAENLEYIIEQGSADYIRKNGVRYFQRSARSNILECQETYLESLPGGVYENAYRNPLRHENLEIMKRYGYRKVRWRVREWLTVAEHAQRVGKKIRVHLPYPAECEEQSDIVLHHSSHPVYISEADQRTAFIETEYKKDEKFEIEFSYTLTVPYYELDPEKVSPEQPDFCTEEELPQIRITPAIRAVADELKGEEKNPLILARRAYEYVTTNMSYSYMREYLCIENIPEFVLFNKRGDCGVMALLFISLCRAMGVPARWQSGSHCRPNRIGSHDWAQFYVAPWGWLHADLSFGEGAHKYGDLELWEHYCGNLDVFREINNHSIGGAFDPPKKYLRTDPYDNQSGEAEYEDEGLGFGDLHKGRIIVEFKDLTEDTEK